MESTRGRKVLVCGGRDYGNTPEQKKRVYDTLDYELADWKGDELCVISGMAKGVDSVAAEWAKERGHRLEAYPAKWDEYGKSAGYRRNWQMLKEGMPDLVIAFPGGAGTSHMTSIAKTAGVAVDEHPTN